MRKAYPGVGASEETTRKKSIHLLAISLNKMTMKQTKVIYWTSTVLFAGFMIFSAVPDIIVQAEAKEFIVSQLGYPLYFLPFLGVAKLLGGLAILMPFLKKIKEWAYAGLVFDLIGATYSNIMVVGFQPSILMMLVFFALAFVSYVYNEKVHGPLIQ